MKLAERVEKWVDAGIIDRATAVRIVDFEKNRGGIGFMQSVLGIGVFAILLGIASIVAANWAVIPSWLKLTSHFVLNGGVATALVRQLRKSNAKPIITELLIAGLAGLTLTFIALVGQVYQTQEPLWKAMSLWLVLISPFLVVLSSYRILMQVWILSFLGTYIDYIGENSGHYSDLTLILSTVLVPQVLMIVGQIVPWRRWREKLSIQISYDGFILMALAVSGMQFCWYPELSDDSRHFMQTNFTLDNGRLSFGICLLLSLAMVAARQRKWLVDLPKAVDILLIVSPVLGFLPILFPHPEMRLLCALLQILYWVLCGWAAAQAGYPRAINLATYAIALRLYAVYVEVFGSLLQTGAGLVISGVLLIALVVGLKRVMPTIREWGAGHLL